MGMAQVLKANLAAVQRRKPRNSPHPACMLAPMYTRHDTRDYGHGMTVFEYPPRSKWCNATKVAAGANTPAMPT